MPISINQSEVEQPSSPNKAARDSNLELLRILAILAVIADHFVGQSGSAVYLDVPPALFYGVLGGFSRLSCAVFVAIGAWFLVGRKFSAKRVLSLWCSLWMYTVVVTVLCRLGGLEVSLGALRWALMPVSTQQLWFLSKYILLLMLSPFLNVLLEKLPRRALLAGLVAFGILLTGYSTLFAEDGIFADTLWTFVYIYLLVGYLRCWPQARLAKVLEHPASFLVGILVMLALAAGKGLARYGDIDGKVMQYLEYYRTALCALPILFTALAAVYFFARLPLGKNAIINTLASATLGVYILHQVPVFYGFLWNGIFRCEAHAGQPWYALLTVAAVYLGCTAIELLRAKLLMPVIENSKPFTAACRFVDAAFAPTETTEGC